MYKKSIHPLINNASRTRPVRKAPPPLRRYTGSVFADLVDRTNYMEPTLAARWQEIVGEEIAAICWPSRLLPNGNSKTLELITRDGTAATRVNFETQNILQAVSHVLGPGTVTRVHISQQAKHPQSAPQNEPPTEQSGTKEKEMTSPLDAVLARYRNSLGKKG